MNCSNEPALPSNLTKAFMKTTKFALTYFPVLLAVSINLVPPHSTFAQSAKSNALTEQLRAEPVDELVREATKYGDPVQGALAFYGPTMNCAKCHEPDSGRRLGPELTEKRDVDYEHLIKSILEPSDTIKEGFETVAVLMADGETLTGIKADETESHLFVDRIEEPGGPRKISKDEIDDWKTSQKSSMPENLANQLVDRAQFLNLIAYLKTISEEGPGRALALKPPTAFLTQLPLPDYESDIDHAGLIRDWNNVSYNRGEKIYELRCASCHGTNEAEGSMPTSLRFSSGKFKHGSDPYSMYKTLTHGYGMMNAQRWMVPQQKYAVVYYLRKKFLEPHNPDQLFEITDAYLRGLPKGSSRGPKPQLAKPWTAMNYGQSFNNTIEVSDGNIAQKGIAIRLDDGPGGVESGKYWLMYEHDTMNVAAAWSDSFIDYHGIHFDGAHGQHPAIEGELHFSNPVGPGWANPTTDSFTDDRLVGRDGRRYGPLDRNWIQYKGMFRFGKQTILKYTVGGTDVLESPSLNAIDDQPVFVRTINIAPHERELRIQVVTLNANAAVEQIGVQTMIVGNDEENIVGTVRSSDQLSRLTFERGSLRLIVPPSKQAVQISLSLLSAIDEDSRSDLAAWMEQDRTGLIKLSQFTNGGPRNYPQTLTASVVKGKESGPFAVDVFKRPTNNPWNCRLRLTGLDFSPDGTEAMVCTWDGSVFKVTGLLESETTWQRVAAGLFQPLGIKWIDDIVFVTCRDQICALRDLNADGEADFYECFNSDHQVTEHFHEFAMGLQTDKEGNFYYAKSARHALTAIVPHHGTLLKVSADGNTTEVVANGFRAANGVCINPDGTFVVTDQEGHWNPKNRINWVEPGKFYGNMFGYHDVTDESDEAMDPPLCWITNSFDRSPGELTWVESQHWPDLNGSLLNFSYGYGKIYIVPHEKANGQIQGGMCAFDLPQFPTGIMRGRFNATDGQLYCCGMFAWSGSQQQPGGLYRVRRTNNPVHLPIGLNVSSGKLKIKFSGELDRNTTEDQGNWSIKTWSLKRTKNYGSEHYDEQQLKIEGAALSKNGREVEIKVPQVAATWCMEIAYSIKTSDGKKLQNKIHNTIHEIGE